VLCIIAAVSDRRNVQLAGSVGILLVVLSWIFGIYSFVPM